MAKRIKNRYLLAQTSVPIDMSLIENQKSLEEKMLKALGTATYSYTMPKIIPASQNEFILRVHRNTEEHAILALSFIKEISGKRLGIYTIKTSGTIKSLREKLIK